MRRPILRFIAWQMFASRVLGSAVFLAATLASGAPSPTLTASDAWIRWLPAALPAAGYATVRNSGDRPVLLIGASTPDYESVMFHESRNQHGVEQMLSIASIQIKPHSQVSFAPQSYHIMLMGPTRPIAPGNRVLLTLHFSDGQSLQVPFDVRSPNGDAAKPTTN